jgi:hypothetical protein
VLYKVYFHHVAVKKGVYRPIFKRVVSKAYIIQLDNFKRTGRHFVCNGMYCGGALYEAAPQRTHIHYFPERHASSKAIRF